MPSHPREGPAYQPHVDYAGTDLEFSGERTVHVDGSRPLRVDRAVLERYFHLTLIEASEQFGVCKTIFKRICRACGIKRWPARRLKMNMKKKALLCRRIGIDEAVVPDNAVEDPTGEQVVQRLQQVVKSRMRGEEQGPVTLDSVPRAVPVLTSDGGREMVAPPGASSPISQPAGELDQGLELAQSQDFLKALKQVAEVASHMPPPEDQAGLAGQRPSQSLADRARCGYEAQQQAIKEKRQMLVRELNEVVRQERRLRAQRQMASAACPVQRAILKKPGPKPRSLDPRDRRPEITMAQTGMQQVPMPAHMLIRRPAPRRVSPAPSMPSGQSFEAQAGAPQAAPRVVPPQAMVQLAALPVQRRVEPPQGAWNYSTQVPTVPYSLPGYPPVPVVQGIQPSKTQPPPTVLVTPYAGTTIRATPPSMAHSIPHTTPSSFTMPYLAPM